MTLAPTIWHDGAMTKDKMIGLKDKGVGGHKCRCCGEAPGKARKVARRTSKRVERRTWKAEVAA